MEPTERFYSNERLIQEINVALGLILNANNSDMKMSEPFSIKILLERDQFKIDIAQTNCDQNPPDEVESEPAEEISEISCPVPANLILRRQSYKLLLNLIPDENVSGGYGDPATDFWIGFDNLRKQMGDERHVLNIKHTLDDGSQLHATYNDFRLHSDGVRIKSLGKYTGNRPKDPLREYENQSAKSPPWVVSIVSDSNRPSKSCVMQIKKWPGRF